MGIWFKLQDFTCPDDGFYAEPDACVGHYYICIGGIASMQVYDFIMILFVNN